MEFNVEMRNVSIRCRSFNILEDVSMNLEHGKIYGLIGRNGAGKTSLLSVLAAFRKPSVGEVIVGDEVLFENEALMQCVSFVYQRNYAEESSRVGKFLKTEMKFRPNFDEAYAEELVEKFGLPVRSRVKHLSKGMQSVLSVVIGLASRSPLTIFDEAYLGMDAPTRVLFYEELLMEQERHPRTIVVSTHLVSEMEYLFDEVVMIHQGRIVVQGTHEDVVSQGVSVTGTVDMVDGFVLGKEVLNTQLLGGVKQAMLYGELSESEQRVAEDFGVEVGTVSLQDLFIHLTKEEL